MRFRVMCEYTQGDEECEYLYDTFENDATLGRVMLWLDREREMHPTYKLRLYKEVTSEDY